jgi:bacterioferritin-associated ferredoxin
MSFDDLQLELGVATQCGQCEGCARDIHSQCQTSAPQAFCHKGDATITVSPIQLAPSILENAAWKLSLSSQAASSSP